MTEEDQSESGGRDGDGRLLGDARRSRHRLACKRDVDREDAAFAGDIVDVNVSAVSPDCRARLWPDRCRRSRERPGRR